MGNLNEINDCMSTLQRLPYLTRKSFLAYFRLQEAQNSMIDIKRKADGRHVVFFFFLGMR